MQIRKWVGYASGQRQRAVIKAKDDSLRYTLYCLISFVLLALCLSVCAVVSYSRWELKQMVYFFSRHINPYKPLEDGENYKNIYLSYCDRCSDIVEKVEEHLEKNGLSCCFLICRPLFLPPFLFFVLSVLRFTTTWLPFWYIQRIESLKSNGQHQY